MIKVLICGWGKHTDLFTNLGIIGIVRCFKEVVLRWVKSSTGDQLYYQYTV